MKKINKVIGAAAAAVLFSCTISGIMNGCSGRKGNLSDESIAGETVFLSIDSHGEKEGYGSSTGAGQSQESLCETTEEHRTERTEDESETVSEEEKSASETDYADKEQPDESSSQYSESTVPEGLTESEKIPEETAVQQTVTPAEPSADNLNTDFTISTITYVNNSSNAFYDELVNQRGYVPVKNTDELRDFCVNNVLSLDHGVKNVMYIISPSGAFDDVVEEIKTISAVAQSNPTAVNNYKKDKFLYDKLGLDYQHYYARGMAVFMMQNAGSVRLKDAGYSLYAVYYYSYQTKEQVQAVNDMASSVTSGFDGETYDKLLAAYDYLKDNVSYARNIDDSTTHTAYAAFYDGTAVCEGYAKAYKIMLDNMGIANEIVVNESHAWNMAQCDGEWYFIDPTNGSVNNCHMYFMLGKDVLESSVSVNIYDCDKPGVYYVFTDADIAYYGYTDGTNTSSYSLAALSKQIIEMH